MSLQTFDPAERLRHYHAAINTLDFDAITACFAEKAAYVSNGIGALRGRDAVMAAFRRYFARFPDQVATDSRVETLSSRSALSIWHLEATDAESGEKTTRSGSEILSFDRDGRIVTVEVTDDL